MSITQQTLNEILAYHANATKELEKQDSALGAAKGENDFWNRFLNQLPKINTLQQTLTSMPLCDLMKKSFTVDQPLLDAFKHYVQNDYAQNGKKITQLLPATGLALLKEAQRQGMHAFTLDFADGKWCIPQLSGTQDNPVHLDIHGTLEIYKIGEVQEAQRYAHINLHNTITKLVIGRVEDSTIHANTVEEFVIESEEKINSPVVKGYQRSLSIRNCVFYLTNRAQLQKIVCNDLYNSCKLFHVQSDSSYEHIDFPDERMQNNRFFGK